MSALDKPDSPTSTRWSEQRVAGGVFVVAVAIAVPVLFRAGRRQWFFLDEFSILSGRELSSPYDLIRPHNEHWSTPLVLSYQILYKMVGLHHYWPYLALAILAHLATATMLRTLIRQVGVGPWIATAAVIPFMFFGRGNENFVSGFQVAWGTSLAFGLLQVIAADHDGPIGRRDLFGLGCGLVAIMASGVGPFLVIAASATALVRRGWRAALLHAGPLGALYLVWSALTESQSSPLNGQGDIAGFARMTITDTVTAMSGSGVAATVLVVGAAIGIGLSWRSVRGETGAVARRLAAPLSLAGAAVLFAVSTAYGRAAISTEPASRYLHVTAALLLPCLAVGIDAYVARWPRVLPAAALVLVMGLPGNLDVIDERHPLVYGNRDVTLTLAVVAHDEQVPRHVRPSPAWIGDLTAGWLADGIESGRIPRPDHIDPAIRQKASLQLAAEVISESQAGTCTGVEPEIPLSLSAGEVVQFQTPEMNVVELVGDERTDAIALTGVPNSGELGRTVTIRASRPVVLDQAFTSPWPAMSRCRP